MKSTRAPAIVLATTVGLVGLGLGAVVAPVAASAATSGGTTVSSRLTAIKDALAGLVKDGTLTQSQADKVATTLDSRLPSGGFGGHGMGMRMRAGLDEVAGIIGISPSALRTELQGGKTLAEIATSHGVSQSTLVSKLVSVAKSRIAGAVKAGRLTQAQADRITTNLQSRITALVTRSWPMEGRGFRGGFEHGQRPDGGTPPAAPSTAPTSSSSYSTSST